MAAVNYDAIAQELKLGMSDNDRTIANLGCDKPMALKELYTLSMGGPRQSGKTKWITENLIRDPNARAIVINSGLENSLINYINCYYHLTPDNKIPVAGGWTTVPDDVAQIIRVNPQVIESIKYRVITATALNFALNHVGHPPVDSWWLVKNDSNQPDQKDADIVQIFIDGRVQVFNLIRCSKYYTWLAKLSDKHILTWLID